MVYLGKKKTAAGKRLDAGVSEKELNAGISEYRK